MSERVAVLYDVEATQAWVEAGADTLGREEHAILATIANALSTFELGAPCYEVSFEWGALAPGEKAKLRAALRNELRASQQALEGGGVYQTAHGETCLPLSILPRPARKKQADSSRPGLHKRQYRSTLYPKKSSTKPKRTMPGKEAHRTKEDRPADNLLSENSLPALDLAGAAREVRIARGKTLREVAKSLDVRLTSWSDIEYRISKMGPDTVEGLPKALDVPMSWLAVLAISDPGPDDDPIARGIRTLQQRILKELNRSSLPKPPRK